MKVVSQIRGVDLRHDAQLGRFVQILKCASCAAEEQFSNAKGAHYPQEALFKFARRKGWAPSAKGRHVCPKCVEVAMTVDEKPREMSAQERRKIWREIDDCYDENHARYVDDFTDEVIARKLGVPRAWVEAIRDENFGPSGENVEMERVASNLGRIAADLTDAINACMEAAARAEKLKAEVDAARVSLDAIRSAVGPKAARA